MIKNFDKKCRLCRQSGEKLFFKGERCFSPKCPIDRKGAILPGQHGAKGRRKVSDFGVRLAEKQKLKKIYGMGEKQMKSYFAEARKGKQDTGERLLQLLESRLDNLVYRLGFSASRRLAKQLVSHKHILVNGKEVNIPSFRAKKDDVISLDSTAMAMITVKKRLEDKEFALPAWLERKAAAGKIARLPKREDIPVNINEQLVIEYYSR